MTKSMRIFILLLVGFFMWGSFSNDNLEATPSNTPQQINKSGSDDLVNNGLSLILGTLLTGVGLGIGVGSETYSGLAHLAVITGMVTGIPGGYHCYRYIRELSKANPGSIK